VKTKRKRKPGAARKRPAAEPKPPACFYGYAPPKGWAERNAVRTADAGVPEPAPYEGSGWDYPRKDGAE
jgi:hypothetical protein